MITAEHELFLSTWNDNIIRFVNLVIRNVESIRFAKQWRMLTEDSRGQLFSQITSSVVIPGQNTGDWQKRSRERYGELIKCRNVLLDLYSTLGPTVLLDTSVLGIAGDTLLFPSKFYTSVYPLISEELGGKNIGKDQYWERRQFTVLVLEALTSLTVVKFVINFLEETKPNGVVDMDDSNR
ncbi:hypothetical protein BT96DRAFT_1010649 [Gymnopus androsaceus JB14]|uniref:Uncharacterized protein n=1 Tax=Gymnopus androsaceus JB14 TaxID=1447944 RepID=A0A6A4GAC5_9AGAR|nr:hypothetical protein BT96DRAFT_1010649 [Gymnopus androsaceus JB14]